MRCLLSLVPPGVKHLRTFGVHKGIVMMEGGHMIRGGVPLDLWRFWPRNRGGQLQGDQDQGL